MNDTADILKRMNELTNRVENLEIKLAEATDLIHEQQDDLDFASKNIRHLEKGLYEPSTIHPTHSCQLWKIEMREISETLIHSWTMCAVRRTCEHPLCATCSPNGTGSLGGDSPSKVQGRSPGKFWKISGVETQFASS